MTATAVRIPAKSGNRDNDYWQAKCGDCEWTDPALYSNRTVEGHRLADRDADEHICASQEPRFFVQAMHTPSNGFDSQRTVEYWRVTDRQSGMRADGTAKYATPEQAQRWCDGLNG